MTNNNSLFPQDEQNNFSGEFFEAETNSYTEESSSLEAEINAYEEQTEDSLQAETNAYEEYEDFEDEDF